MDMLGIAVLIGLIGVYAILDSRLLGRLNGEQPLITSALVGLVLGNLPAGLAAGATIELMSMGLVHVGAAMPPDMVMGGIIATAFSILTGTDPETAVAIAVPVAVLGQLLGIAFRTLIAALTHSADKAIDAAEFSKATGYHIIWGTVLYSLMYFIPIFLAVYLGTDFVQTIVSSIPAWVTAGLKLASKLLTSYGLALLLSLMVNGKMIAFFLLGFFVCAYFNINVTAISIFGVLTAAILLPIKFNKPEGVAVDTSNGNTYDPLEDDED